MFLSNHDKYQFSNSTNPRRAVGGQAIKPSNNITFLLCCLASAYYIFAAMQPVNIRIINKSENPLPQYETLGSSGMDVRASLAEPVSLQPLERALIPTGLFVEIPEGFEAQIRPRSGMAIKHGITCLNTPGTIDADYRGEIKIILINFSAEKQIIHPGDRIAQMIIQRVEKAEWESAEILTETVRSGGGFGHTGKQ
jgi:dUTP pyrophosphatase